MAKKDERAEDRTQNRHGDINPERSGRIVSMES